MRAHIYYIVTSLKNEIRNLTRNIYILIIYIDPDITNICYPTDE